MVKTIHSVKRYVISKRTKMGRLILPEATREDVEKALDKYLSNGGLITRIEPDWIEEGELFNSN